MLLYSPASAPVQKAGETEWAVGEVYTDTGAYNGCIPYIGVGTITTGPTDGYRAYEVWAGAN